MASGVEKLDSCMVTRSTWDALKRLPKIQAAKVLYALLLFQMDGEETPRDEIPQPARFMYGGLMTPLNGRQRRRNGKV